MAHSKCQTCHDYGLVRVRYRDEDGFDLVICACPKGQPFMAPHRVSAWAAQQHVTPTRVFLFEELDAATVASEAP